MAREADLLIKEGSLMAPVLPDGDFVLHPLRDKNGTPTGEYEKYEISRSGVYLVFTHVDTFGFGLAGLKPPEPDATPDAIPNAVPEAVPEAELDGTVSDGIPDEPPIVIEPENVSSTPIPDEPPWETKPNKVVKRTPKKRKSTKKVKKNVRKGT